MSVWTGRVDTADGDNATRWHQKVQPLEKAKDPGVVLIGFPCDEGVRRNQGRVGAKDGPKAIRTALANFAWRQRQPVYDAGDVGCTNTDLSNDQKRLNEDVYHAITAGHRPIVLGGGHEAAWGSYVGLVRAVQAIDPKLKVGIINLDSHFDLRGDAKGSSGTPFAQISRWCSEIDRLFWYMCLGVAEPSNTAALFERAKRFNVKYRYDIDLDPWLLSGIFEEIQKFIAAVDLIHLSIDLDVLPASDMPAVSAPAIRGVPIASIEAILATILTSGKVAVTDLVELNPTYDVDGRGARTAARLAWLIAKEWPGVLAEAED
ncbi:MAG TPA: formimidoylglutamase [Gemmata sp.]|nr:formimidoylglutamase [Gemmata sp.]